MAERTVLLRLPARCTYETGAGKGSFSLCYPGSEVSNDTGKLGEVSSVITGGVQITRHLPEGRIEVWLIRATDLWDALQEALRLRAEALGSE